jgi:hypothetical protein
MDASRDSQIAQLTEERNAAQTALININALMNQLTNSTATVGEFDANQVETDITFKINRISELFAEKRIRCVVDAKQYICMAYEYPIGDGSKGMHVLHVAGQNVNAQEAVANYTKDFVIHYEWKEIISFSYYDNTNDFLGRIKKHIVEYRNNMLKKVKATDANEVRDYNAALKEEIKAFNNANPDNKRIFNNEKRALKKILSSDLGIEASKYTSTYIENEYVSMDEYIEMLRDIRNI